MALTNLLARNTYQTRHRGEIWERSSVVLNGPQSNCPKYIPLNDQELRPYLELIDREGYRIGFPRPGFQQSTGENESTPIFPEMLLWKVGHRKHPFSGCEYGVSQCFDVHIYYQIKRSEQPLWQTLMRKSVHRYQLLIMLAVEHDTTYAPFELYDSDWVPEPVALAQLLRCREVLYPYLRQLKTQQRLGAFGGHDPWLLCYSPF